MLGKVGKRDKLIDIENALKLANADGTVTYEEIRQNLKKCNFSDLEIEMFFAKYDLDGDGTLDTMEGGMLLDDIDTSKVDADNERPLSGREARDLRSARIRSAGQGRPMTAAGGINHEEFGLLRGRVDRMEGAIGSIVSKIDMVLIKLESMEKSKSKRKATMSKIMEGFTDPELDDATKRKEMEDLLRNWDSESRPGTSGDAI